MRVAYICADPGVPVFGRKGCSIHVQEVIRALNARAARVELFASRVEGTPPSGLGDVRVHALPDPRGSDPCARERAALRANAPLRLALERTGPFDLVYERHSLWSVEGMRFARDHAVAGLLEVNGPLIDEQAEHRTLCDTATASLTAKNAFAAAQTIVAVSKGAAAYVERFIGTTDKLHVMPNGVDPTRFPDAPAPRRRGNDDSFTVGFVGSLKPWHGLPTLIDAFARLHAEDARARLLIVGDGPERARLDEGLAALALSNATRFTGAVPPDRVPLLLASMDAAVAPYSARPDFYFSPLKVLEYMAAWRPVVASRLGQLEDLITDGETGLLCTPDDPGELARHLRRLRDDGELCRRLGSAARAAVAARHTWQQAAARILCLTGLEVEARS
ncbi:MAG: glycosyltransferase family 4 protein [Vicinamibacteraceae bacterium]